MIPPFNKIKDQTQMIRESLPLILIKIKPKIETLVKLRRMQLIYEGYDVLMYIELILLALLILARFILTFLKAIAPKLAEKKAP
jgi:hypothetical protein